MLEISRFICLAQHILGAICARGLLRETGDRSAHLLRLQQLLLGEHADAYGPVEFPQWQAPEGMPSFVLDLRSQ